MVCHAMQYMNEWFTLVCTVLRSTTTVPWDSLTQTQNLSLDLRGNWGPSSLQRWKCEALEVLPQFPPIVETATSRHATGFETVLRGSRIADIL
jgi:hypothetical protein